jgi:hypothetical protein
MAIKTNHITYLQMMDIFEVFANEHYEINHFGNGDFWEVVENIKLGDGSFDYTNYPLLWVVDAGATFADGELDYSFQIIVCDIQFDKDGEALYENQIKSNMLLVYQDLLAYIKINPQFKGSSVRIFEGGTSNGQSFTERFSDNLVGWVFDLTIRQAINLNICEIPKA